MGSTSETGHAKNAANFGDLIAFVTGYGITYNPSKTLLKLAQLNTLKTTADTKLTDVITKNTAFNTKVNDRITAFDGLPYLSTRLVSALESTNATTLLIKDAKGFNRKLHGKRATPAANPPVDPNTPAPTTISTSQLSFDQQIQHFTGLIAVLQSETTYTPNETDLKITTLTTKLADLTTKNNTVATAYTNVSNSRISRNSTLYGTDTGIFDIAAAVKKYVKSIFGPSSPEFAQIKGIEFKNIK